MANIQKDILFDHFISGMEKEMQATLRMMYLNSCNIDEANRRPGNGANERRNRAGRTFPHFRHGGRVRDF